MEFYVSVPKFYFVTFKNFTNFWFSEEMMGWVRWVGG